MFDEALQAQQLEDASVLYMQAGGWSAAIGIAAALARLAPDNPNGWYAIGSGLWRLSLDNPALLDLAIAVLKRSVAVNPQPSNRTFKEMLFTASQSAEKAGLDPETIPPFDGDPQVFTEAVDFTPDTLIAPAQGMEWDQRARLIALVEDQPGDMFLPLLRALAASDPHTMVKRSAEKALAARPAPPPSAPPVEPSSAPTEDTEPSVGE